MVTRLSVPAIGGMMMGVWFLSSAFAAYAGGPIAGLTALPEGTTEIVPTETLPIYTGVFANLAMIAVGLGVLLLIVAPFLARRMRGG